MNLKKTVLVSATIYAITTGAVQVQAASLPPLVTQVFGEGGSSAVFAGGATVNGGANFLATIPADQKPGILATVVPSAADIGNEADFYMAVNAGTAWYMRTPTGFVPWNSSVATLLPFATKTMAASETINISDLEALSGYNLDGRALRVHVGYMTDTSPLVYSSAIPLNVAMPPAATCPVGDAAGLDPIVPAGKRLCVLSGTYTSDVHLTANFEYVVSGPVFFGGDNQDSVQLTIDAGVKTYGESGADFIRISRGSQIHVNGSPDAPVIMTAAIDAEADDNTTGAWGGLVLNGNAPLNGCTAATVLCQAEGEGNSGTYGGNNPTESSGNLNYLIIKYAGFEISPGNELNSLTLNAIGSGTLIDYVQLHNGSDDGFETFGGTVNAKHLVLSGNDDDALDWQKGWTGKAQHVLVIPKTIGDRGIEADNNSSARDSLPRSKPQIANMTIVAGASNGNAIKLRDGTAGNMSNIVVKSTGASCVDIDHGPTFANAGASATSLSGELTIVNSLLDCTTFFSPAVDDLWDTQAWFTNQAGNLLGASGIATYVNSATVNARPAADLSADGFFDNVDHIGAVKDATSDWTLGWTFRAPFEAL